jgi:hypothetical protein
MLRTKAIRRYFDDAQETPVQRIVLVVSLWWASNGVIAYWINPSFSLHPMSMRTVHFFVVPITVNAWHALFHFVTGAVGLILVRQRQSATIYAFVFAALYETVGILGMRDGEQVLGMMAVDRFGCGVHMAEGLIVLTGGLLALLPERRNASDMQ